MKKVLAILTLLTVVGGAYAYNYDKNLPLAGATLTDEKLQAEALFPVYAFGPGAEHFTGLYENTAIFDKIATLLKLKK